MKYSYIDKLTESEVPKDPLISPMYASSEILRQLPPMRFLVILSHFYPKLKYFHILISKNAFYTEEVIKTF